MSDQNNNGNDEETKHDLTRVEDLSEFLHQDDPEADAIFAESAGADEDDSELPPPFEFNTSIDDLDDADSSDLSDSEESYEMSDQDDFSDSDDELTQDSEDGFENDLEGDYQEEFQDDGQEGLQDDLEDNFEENSDDNYNDNLEDNFEDNFENNFEDNFEDDFENNSEDDSTQGSEDTLEDDSEDNDEEFDEESDVESFHEDFNEDFNENFDENSEEYLEDDKQGNNQGDFTQSNSQLTESPIPHIPDQHDMPEIGDEQSSLETSHIQTTPPQQRETFDEVRNFANNMSYGTVKVGGNPAFTLLLKDIIGEDYHESILAILNEHGLVGDDEKMIRTSLEIGHLLVPQISEYSAIYLAGKLRKYARDVQVGLAEEIHDSKSYEKDTRGLVSKRSIFQNKDLQFKRNESEFDPESMESTTQSKFQHREIVDHLGIVTCSGIYELDELSEQTLEYEDEMDNSQLSIGSTEIYNILLAQLKKKAFKLGANALIGVNYTMTAINQEEATSYNIICTGDAVIISQ